jgi:hypothetical protein
MAAENAEGEFLSDRCATSAASAFSGFRLYFPLAEC